MLLDEAQQAADEAKAQRIAERLKTRAKYRDAAVEKFVAAFGETPTPVETGVGKEIETRNGRTHVSAWLECEGLEFIGTHGRGGYFELRLVLTCPTCGRRFASDETFGPWVTGEDSRPYNVKRLANALAEPKTWKRHECEANVLKPLRYAIREAAGILNMSEAETASAALSEEVR